MIAIPANTAFQVACDKIGVQLASVPAVLQYAVKPDEGWTSWSEQITENSTVVSNIPKGLYLRFNVDAKITD